MKYKLIKEYPGSPELGTEVDQETSSKSYFFRSGDRNICVLKNHIENNPEYWEKVNDDIWWCVWEEDYDQDLVKLFRAWFVYKIECVPKFWDDDRRYFKTKQEAEEFILNNKPCLSYNNIAGYLSSSQRDIILNLIKKL